MFKKCPLLGTASSKKHSWLLNIQKDVHSYFKVQKCKLKHQGDIIDALCWREHAEIFSQTLLVGAKIATTTVKLNMAASIKNCSDPAIPPLLLFNIFLTYVFEEMYCSIDFEYWNNVSILEDGLNKFWYIHVTELIEYYVVFKGMSELCMYLYRKSSKILNIKEQNMKTSRSITVFLVCSNLWFFLNIKYCFTNCCIKHL